MPANGELARWPLLYLYYLAASRGVSGLLSLALNERTLTIHFRKGAPDVIESSHPEDALEPFLLKSGALTTDQVARARAEAPRFGGDLSGALIGTQLVPPQQLFALLSQRAHTLLLGGVVAAEGGTFTFDASVPPPPQAFPLGDRWGLLSALVRMMPPATLRWRLQPVWNRPVMKTGGSVDVMELRFTPQETRSLSRFDGVQSLEQLTAALPAEADSLMRLAFLLRHLEAVTFLPPSGADAQPGATPPPVHGIPSGAAVRPPSRPLPPSAAGVRPPTPPQGAPPVLRPPGVESAVPPAAAVEPRSSSRPSPPPQPSATAGRMGTRPLGTGVPPPATVTRSPPPAALRTAAGPGTRTPAPAKSDTVEDLAALLAQLGKQNHFERLGIPMDAPGGAAKIAYFKLARLHHPDTVPHGAPPETAKLKADIFAAIGEAYRTLSDEASRAQYVEELKSGAGEVDVLAILKAEELFNRASLLVKNRRFRDAVDLLEDAIVLNPDEGEFYAWRGYARFLAQPEGDRSEGAARADLDEAVRRNPRCVEAHYFLGVVCKLVGNTSEALVHFKRTVQLKPDHVDAAREVRILGAKK